GLGSRSASGAVHDPGRQGIRSDGWPFQRGHRRYQKGGRASAAPSPCRQLPGPGRGQDQRRPRRPTAAIDRRARYRQVREEEEVTLLLPAVTESSPGLTWGNVQLPTPFLLAPLAGYTTLAFRLAVRELGGLGLATTDLVNARALLRCNRRTMELIQ